MRPARQVVETRRGIDPEFVFTYRGHTVRRLNNSGGNYRSQFWIRSLEEKPVIILGLH